MTDHGGSALPWLYGIAGNVLRHHLRDTRAGGTAAHGAGMDWDAVAARLDAQARRGELRAALSVLSPAERDLLLLVAWEELTPAEAARAAGNAAAKQQGGWPGTAYWDVVSVYQRSGKTYHREIWVSHHGQSVLRDNGVSDGVLPLGPGLFPAGGTSLTWDQLYALPTHPAQLTAALQADVKGAGPDAQSELFTIVGDLLRESPAPPALRKALYDVAAGIPGVHLTGKVTDGLGRAGTGVERGGETLVIDPADGRLLADDEGDGWSATFVSQDAVDSAPVASASAAPADGAPAPASQAPADGAPVTAS